MIGPFSFCKISKTLGIRKQVNKQTNKRNMKEFIIMIDGKFMLSESGIDSCV